MSDQVTASGSVSAESAQPASETPDLNTFMDEIRGGFEGMSREVQTARSEAQDAKDRISKIHSAFAEKDSSEPEIDEVDSYADEVLAAHLEGMKNGQKGIPLTAKTAMLLQKTNAQLKEAMKIINDLKGRTDTLSDPNMEFDRRAYANLDMELQNTIEKVYGKADAQIVGMASQKIINEVQRIQRERPDIWQQIRKNPEYQKRLVMHHVEQIIPPKARELLRNEKIQNTPMSNQDLWQAFREAGEKYKDNPTMRQKIQTSIRQEIISRKFG